MLGARLYVHEHVSRGDGGYPKRIHINNILDIVDNTTSDTVVSTEEMFYKQDNVAVVLAQYYCIDYVLSIYYG